MHAHDRTMLASLGFADPDKRDSRHDLACQYIAQPESRQKLADMMVSELIRRENGTFDRGYWKGEKAYELISIDQGSYEVPISKGSGQYRTTIGFIDLILPCTYRLSYHGHLREGYDRCVTWKEHSSSREFKFDIVIETKVNPICIGDVLRQIGLYREYKTNYRDSEDPIENLWFLVTTYPLSAIDIESLASSKIHHVRLGSSFEKWAEWQTRPSAASDPNSSGSIVL